MASFKDKNGDTWQVDFDPVLVSEIKSEVGINLIDLTKDPLSEMVDNPEKLWLVIQMTCQEQYEKRGMTAEQFSKVLCYPPDAILDALREAVVSFFPSSKASHIREVFGKFDEMKTKTNQLTTSKMTQILNDPKVMKALDTKADEVIKKAIDDLMVESSGV